MTNRILMAVVYGIGAILVVLQTQGVPSTVEGWIGIVVSFIVAAWGKFSSEQTLIAANRKIWTESQRVAAREGQQ